MPGLLRLLPLVQGMAYIGISIGALYRLAPADDDHIIGTFPGGAALAESFSTVTIPYDGHVNYLGVDATAAAFVGAFPCVTILRGGVGNG